MPQSYLEVPVHDAHSVQVVDSIQDLPNQCAGILLSVEPFLNDAVEKLSPRHSGKHDGMHKWEDMLCNVLSTSLKHGHGHALAPGSPNTRSSGALGTLPLSQQAFSFGFFIVQGLVAPSDTRRVARGKEKK